MGQNSERSSARCRRARVNRLKKIILITIAVLLVLPIFLCLILFVNLIRLDRRLDEFGQILEQLEKQVSDQNGQMENVSSLGRVLIEEERKEEPAGINSEVLPGRKENPPAESNPVQEETGEEMQKEPEEMPEEPGEMPEEPEEMPEEPGEMPEEPEEMPEEPEEMPEEPGEMLEEPEETIVDVPDPELEQHAHFVYLTFDDGPSIYTDEILDILAEYNVRATFFVLGKDSEEDQRRLKRIVAEGHTLGMHSYTHRYSELYASVESFAKDFKRIQDYLYDVTGVVSTFYRFPGGSSNTVSNVDMHKLAEYLEEQDVEYFDWNISSGDADNIAFSVEELVANSVKNIEKFHTAVILFHDSASKHSTVEALPQIIENILAMDDAVILPITENTEPVQHNIKQ